MTAQAALKTRASAPAPIDSLFPILMRMPTISPAVLPTEPAKSAVSNQLPPIAEAKSTGTMETKRDKLSPDKQPETKAENRADLLSGATTQAVQAATASEQKSALSETKPGTTIVTPAEPITAASTATRAEARARRNQADGGAKSSWWKTHAPVIAVGFLIALVVTVSMARSNKGGDPSKTDVADSDVPVVDIQVGGSIDPTAPKIEAPSLVSHVSNDSEMAEHDHHHSHHDEATTLSKSPSLLSATPIKSQGIQVGETPAIEVAAKPQADHGDRMSADSEPNHAEESNPTTVAKPASAEEPAPTEGPTLDSPYPMTDPSVYRTGGRAPRVAPNQTATPDTHSWR